MRKDSGPMVVSDETFEDAIMSVLQEAVEDAEALVEQLLDETAQGLESQLRRDSPRDTGEYAAGWTTVEQYRMGSKVRVVRNEAKPELTHLLEYGHESDNGVVAQRPHIRLAFEDEMELLDQKLGRYV